MGRDVLSMRQMMVLLTVALLAPATELLPTLTANRAGGGGWLAVLAVLPVLLIALWAASGLVRGGGLRGALGNVIGTIIIIMYMAWTLLTLTLNLRLSGARLAELYGERFAFGCIVVSLAVAVWMGLGKTSALARAGEVFYLALAVALGGMILLGAFHVEWDNLLPFRRDAAGIPWSALASAGLLLNIFPAAALGDKVNIGPRSGHRAVGWTITFCVALALATAAVIGCLGPALTARLPTPFLTMVQGLQIKGAIQRTEALLSALWVLSDLILLGLLLHTWRALAGQLRPGRWGRWSVIPAALAALAAGWLAFPREEDVRGFCVATLPLLGLILGLLLPLFAQIPLRMRRKKN